VIREGFIAIGWPSKRIMRPTLWLEDTAMVVYAFDVDDTLEVSKGPVKLVDLVNLREHGHIVGLCGNWAMVTLHCPDWHHICSFVGPCGIEKHDFLANCGSTFRDMTT
jgi:hypothetical protein